MALDLPTVHSHWCHSHCGFLLEAAVDALSGYYGYPTVFCVTIGPRLVRDLRYLTDSFVGSRKKFGAEVHRGRFRVVLGGRRRASAPSSSSWLQPHRHDGDGAIVMWPHVEATTTPSTTVAAAATAHLPALSPPTVFILPDGRPARPLRRPSRRRAGRL